MVSCALIDAFVRRSKVEKLDEPCGEFATEVAGWMDLQAIVIARKADHLARKITPVKKRRYFREREIPAAFYDFLREFKLAPDLTIPEEKKYRTIDQLIRTLTYELEGSNKAAELRWALLEQSYPIQPVVEKQLASTDLTKPRVYLGKINTMENLFEAMLDKNR